MALVGAVLDALRTAFDMTWEVLWPLCLGFMLSGIVQALVSHRALARTLGHDSPRSLTLATLFGVASSSCSYAAVALARSIFVKGASFTAAMAFELASTNLVVELGIILVVLMGWQFAAAEYAGGLLMVVFLALLLRLTLTPAIVERARRHAEEGRRGRMEGHAGMDMSVTEGPFLLAAAVRPLGTAVLAGASALWLLAYRELGPARTANAGQFGRAPRVRLGRGVFAWLRDPVYDAYALGLAGAGLSRGNPAYLALAAESVLLLNIAEARVERSTLSGTGTRRPSNTPVGPR